MKRIIVKVYTTSVGTINCMLWFASGTAILMQADKVGSATNILMAISAICYIQTVRTAP